MPSSSLPPPPPPTQQQYIELRRRVSRPFARMKLVVTKPDFEEPQSPGYTAVETLKSGKTAVLSLLVRLPGNQEGGHAEPGRSGLCVGSTLVRVNPSKKPKTEKPNKKVATPPTEGSTAVRSRRRERSRSNSAPMETLT